MYIGVNGAISFVASVFVLIRTTAVYSSCLRAARSMHTASLKGVLSASMAFLDTTPTGRLLNRFGKDLQVVDMQLNMSLTQVRAPRQCTLCVRLVLGCVACTRLGGQGTPTRPPSLVPNGPLVLEARRLIMSARMSDAVHIRLVTHGCFLIS